MKRTRSSHRQIPVSPDTETGMQPACAPEPEAPTTPWVSGWWILPAILIGAVIWGLGIYALIRLLFF
jgi:hypothetical protein